jgi:hypothetical protein
VRIERVLVVGATGLIGTPVARQLLADGHRVRVLVRDPDRAHAQLGLEFEYVSGAVTDSAAVDRAVRGIDAVHISLGVEDPTQGAAPGVRRGLRRPGLPRLRHAGGRRPRVLHPRPRAAHPAHVRLASATGHAHCDGQERSGGSPRASACRHARASATAGEAADASRCGAIRRRCGS